MNSAIFQQNDSRWKDLPYKSKSNVGGAGCGLVSVTHCLIEQEKYSKSTPKDFYSYMRPYATDGQGTLYSGITSGLKHFGMEDVKTHANISDVFKILDKEKRVGILLFNNNRGPDGTLWTSSGHYIAFTDYKVVKGRHYLYLKDSGTRKHIGWYIYEESIRGCLKVQIWTCKIPDNKQEPPKKEEEEMFTYDMFDEYMKVYLSNIKKEKAEEYAIDALNWANENKIMVGDQNGNLMPKAPVEREDVVVMLKRYDEMKKSNR